MKKIRSETIDMVMSLFWHMIPAEHALVTDGDLRLFP